MTTLIAYLILQVTILTGGTTATSSKATTSYTTTTKCPNTGSGWDDKD